MNNQLNGLSPSGQTAAKVLHAALTILKENDGSMPGREVMQQIERRVELSGWEKTRYEKTGYIRWQTILSFYTIGCVKMGLLQRKRGTWHITEEGEKAVEMSPEDLIVVVKEGYRKWKREQPAEETTSGDGVPAVDDGGVDGEEEIALHNVALEQVEELAADGLRKHVEQMNPYEFQELVGALLRGMGYHTPFIAPKGKDGGIDIIAFQDPLGTKTPRVKVQVKHHMSSKVSVDVVRSLLGVLSKDGDIGLIVNSGGFTNDARFFVRTTHTHIMLMDLDEFFELWIDNYDKLDEEDKRLMPLQPVYFLAAGD